MLQQDGVAGNVARLRLEERSQVEGDVWRVPTGPSPGRLTVRGENG